MNLFSLYSNGSPSPLPSPARRARITRPWLENRQVVGRSETHDNPPTGERCSLSRGERVRVNGNRAIFVWLAVLFSAVSCLANSSVDAAFDAANKLYAENKFAEAATAYERIGQSNGVSAALLFNLGNAHYKAGQVGLAIAAYRRAEQLAPRDADLRANLQFVRSQVQGPTVRPGFLERTLALLRLNEWTGLSAGALWLTFGLLAVRQLRPALAPSLRNACRVAALLTVLLGGALAFAARAQSANRTVIVTQRETSVRITPNDEARPAFTANDGAELRVLDRKGDWLQVSDRTARNYGWLKSSLVAAP